MKRRRRRRKNPSGSTVLWVLGGLALFVMFVGYPTLSVGIGRLKEGGPSS